MSEHKITRKEAAKLIEALRDCEARHDNVDVRALLAVHFERAGIPPLTKCPGDAHNGVDPHADNCGVCMPRWGLVGHAVKVT